MKFFLHLIIYVVCMLTSCQSDTVYHRYHALTSEGWQRNDTLTFQLPPDFTYHRYNIEVGVRHTEVYPFRDLWIEIIHPLTPAIHPDTIHLTLADQQGNWIGKGSANSFYQFSLPAGEITCYPADSILQIAHLMNFSPLKGITDVGIKLSLPRRIDTKEYE